MNDVRLEIIRILMQDARTSFSTIAKKLNVSSDTISRIYKKLIDEDIIQRASIILDLKKFGYTVMFTIFLRINTGFDPNKIFEKLIEIQNLFVVSKTVGDADFTLLGFSRDFKDFNESLNKIGEIKGIKGIEFFLCPQTNLNIPYKQYYEKALFGTIQKKTE